MPTQAQREDPPGTGMWDGPCPPATGTHPRQGLRVDHQVQKGRSPRHHLGLQPGPSPPGRKKRDLSDDDKAAETSELLDAHRSGTDMARLQESPTKPTDALISPIRATARSQ